MVSNGPRHLLHAIRDSPDGSRSERKFPPVARFRQSLAQLENDVAGVAHELRADLDPLLSESRRRPIFYRL